MILSTLNTIPNKTISENCGLVSGSSVRTTSAKDDVLSGVKGLVGGEIKKSAKIIEEAKTEAINRLIEAAKVLGADAVLGINFTINSNIAGASELLVYGTAVKL